jgi:hypothetical protein
MAAVAKAALSKEELAHRWNEIVKQFERVDLDGWIIETNQYGQILMSPLKEGAHQYRGSTLPNCLALTFLTIERFTKNPFLPISVSKTQTLSWSDQIKANRRSGPKR